jgi:hypothetical protein
MLNERKCIPGWHNPMHPGAYSQVWGLRTEGLAMSQPLYVKMNPMQNKSDRIQARIQGCWKREARIWQPEVTFIKIPTVERWYAVRFFGWRKIGGAPGIKQSISQPCQPIGYSDGWAWSTIGASWCFNGALECSVVFLGWYRTPFT